MSDAPVTIEQSALTSERVQYLIRYFSEDAWATHPAALDTIAALRELLELREEATIVATAIREGAGSCIKDTLMEADFRKALRLPSA